MRVAIQAAILSFFVSNSFAAPPAPTDADHPGGKYYRYEFSKQTLKCMGRDVTVFAPTLSDESKKISVVVYGHGQALKLEHYAGTFEHLAKKGIAVIFPIYDKGFFDQDWGRMGRDYLSLSLCAMKANPQFSHQQVVFSGHSKGAYVASIAAGLGAKDNLGVKPGAAVLFGLAGFDAAAAAKIAPEMALTLVLSDREKVVSRDVTESLYQASPSRFKQLIDLKSYPADSMSGEVVADHFWPQTKAAIFGGRSENALHYFGSWKWLVAAAEDLEKPNQVTHPYLYGSKAGDKGIAGFRDEIKRNHNFR